MILSDDLRDYYEEQFNMFASVGWKDMIEDLNKVDKGLRDITTVTPETLLNRQGRIAELSFILSRKEIISQAYEELSNGP